MFSYMNVVEEITTNFTINVTVNLKRYPTSLIGLKSD